MELHAWLRQEWAALASEDRERHKGFGRTDADFAGIIQIVERASSARQVARKVHPVVELNMASGMKRTGRNTGPRNDDNTALRIKLRGRDNAPLSIGELREGLLEAARALATYEKDYRARSASIYLTIVDQDGQAVRINKENELTIYPYRTAADEHGL